ncbi:MAG: Beta/alpha-amylase [Flavobacteriaceae bacterium]|nr:MAG: Beta/alpha-amylase [Flavobacteriaceae bacterium]
MRKFRILLGLFLFTLWFTKAQDIRVEPPNWWVGMANAELQLLIKADDIGGFQVKLKKGRDQLIKSVHQADSPNYLFINLDLSSVKKPEKLVFEFSKGTSRFEYEYELRELEFGSDKIEGFNSGDAVYLITPDRFVNGDESNDQVPGLKEQTVDRSHDYKRHGGDIAGIIKAIPYLKDLGMSAVWSSPLLVNDMAEQSYHGYAITDFFKVDPRFGSLREYRLLADELRNRKMKLIMDQVNNHCGSNHWWMSDLPFSDWINGQEAFLTSGEITYSNHRRTTIQDPYAAQKDREAMLEGWFVSAMPDLNHRNPFMARYLIQNSLWWIETLGLGGIRQDTYPYNDPAFMAEWAQAIQTQYPKFTIVGEEWSYNPLRVGYWQQSAPNADGYESHLPSVFDFPLQKALVDALTNEESWDKGLVEWYTALSNDFYYANPKALVFMGDNHDMDRLYTQLSENTNLHHMALALLAMAPRTPQLYYGTEILMQNTAKPHDHGLIRTDFPGGWHGDEINAFTKSGLTSEQKVTQTLFAKLFQLRSRSEAMRFGETLHYAPNDGVYVISRFAENEKLVLFLNKNEEDRQIDLSDYKELQGYDQYYDLINEVESSTSKLVKIRSRSFLLIQMKS